MLALDDGEEKARGARQPKNASGGRRPESGEAVRAWHAAFAGLDFELTGDSGACERVARAAAAVAPSHARTLSPDAISLDMTSRDARGRSSTPAAADTSAPKFAACCRLQMVSPPAGEQPLPEAGLAWDWALERGELATRLGGAQIESVPGGFSGRAWLDADARAPHHLLGGLAVMLSHRLGGGVFHAASVELDGSVVAFVGPSGAGKSTACRHMAGAPLVSVDRLALLPLGSTWFSHPLPGGTRPVPDMPGLAPCWRPLGAILRVQQSSSGTAIVAPSAAHAVTLLRESTFQSGLQPSAERELLGALEHLVQHVPVARLELQLGASLEPLLRRWLWSQAKEPR